MKYILLFLLFFSNFFSVILAQNKKLDSLVKITENNPKQDTNLVKNYMIISQTFFSQNNMPKAVFYNEKAIKLANELKNLSYMSIAYTQLAYNYFILGDFPQALQIAQKSVSYAEESQKDDALVNALQILGKIYEGQNKVSESKKLYEKVLKIHEKNIAKNPNNLYFQSNIALTYNNLGNADAILGNFDEALEYQKKSLKIRESIPQQAPVLTFSYNDIAYVYGLKKDFKNATLYYEKAKDNVEKYKDSLYIGLIYINLADAYFNTKNFTKSFFYAEKGLKISQKSNAKQSILQASNLLADLYKETKNYEKSLFYKDLFIAYTDSIYNEKRLAEITKIEQNYALDKEKKKTEILEKEKIIRETKIQEQFYIILFSLVGVGLLFALATFLWRNNKLKQKNNEILLEKNEEINQQNEEIQQIADNLQMANEQIVASNRVISENNKNMLDNITYSQRIQEAILPEKDKILAHLPEHFIYFQPKDIVSGDFYFFEHVNQDADQKSIFCAIDCTGHGVSGAFMTILANDLLHNIIINQHITSPDLILNELHKAIRKALKQNTTQNRDGMDMAIVVINHQNNTLEYAGAKNPLYLIQNNKTEPQTNPQPEIQIIKGDRFCIGGEQREIERIFTKHIFEIQPNNTWFYLCSDGFQDQFGGENREKFRSTRLKDLIVEHHQKPMPEQQKILKQTLENWKNQANEIQTDDILVIGGKI